ncbi:glycoside hydrolase family 88 protein [Jejuia pallidilutea]|nr:glycoside hydrolase family 88 protein [Jejuia pallidilutea]GAL71820.1 glycosyl hydrolase family 88 [Jejuia pallidilutea]
MEASREEKNFYKLALTMSGSVQAKRWTNVKDGGYIYSFNGPHSLFIDTIRTTRILLAAHKLGHRMLDENDQQIDFLQRAVTHGLTTAKYAVFYGEGRDTYDEWGRVAHESIFNTNDGNYRCPNSQQGFSGFTTWTRGLAWAMSGFTEFLEYLNENHIKFEGLDEVKATFLKAAKATCDFYIGNTSSDGIPYWDTGAPNIHNLGNYQERKAEIYNDFEPIDSSAAAIGAQGLLRLSNLLKDTEPDEAKKYHQAGLTTLKTLLTDDYLAVEPSHQGILKHSVYHWPNGWDNVPKGKKVPADESSMWGDYHMVELCFLVHKLTQDKYYTFFDNIS